ncbi:hypothetical protein X977_4901 [Burkholderia pseudomallei MSHR7504]|nr:hypothetical protein X977_4901 [Burkholderia pseudomallei MSHR7504]
MLSRNAATRCSAVIVPSSIIWLDSRTISPLISRCTWCCIGFTSRHTASSCANGMMHTVLSSSATASLLWCPAHTPSRPSVSPTIWKPVTCSWPSRCMTTVLNEPVRTA